MTADSQSRWAGRNSLKDVARSQTWRALGDQGVSIGPSFDHIPNFVGADVAAKRLSVLDEWKRARTLTAMTPIAATVHSQQRVEEPRVVTETHDNARDFIATGSKLIGADTRNAPPTGVAWDQIRPDQYADIPFLRAMRAKIEARRNAK